MEREIHGAQKPVDNKPEYEERNESWEKPGKQNYNPKTAK
jgi:hypothetical protein